MRRPHLMYDWFELLWLAVCITVVLAWVLGFIVGRSV